MDRIISLNNERVRRVQALQRSTRRRYREGLMVVEGFRLVREALQSNLPVAEMFLTETFAISDASARGLAQAVQQRGIPCWEVSPEVMAALSDTETPQGILAVMPIPDLRCGEGIPFILIPDGVRDPGNLGTMLRTAWAAGVSQVLLPPGAVDFTNPKVVRSGMGAHFNVPVRRGSWEEIGGLLSGVEVWLAEAGRGIPYDDVDWRGRVALIIGGEAEGAGAGAQALAGRRSVYIPMASGVDSLNAATAAAIVLFEAARQRRAGDIPGAL